MIRILHEKLDLERLQDLFGDDADLYFKARFLSLACLGMASALLMLWGLFMALPAILLDERTTRFFAPLLLVFSILLLGCNAILRKGHYHTAAYTTFVLLFFAIMGAISMLGGFPRSVAAPAIMLVPVIAFLLFGRWIGLMATWLAPALFIAEWQLLLALDISLPDYTSSMNPDLNNLITILFVYGVVVGVLAAYDANAAVLREGLRAERAKYRALANLDALTGLANTRHFNHEMDRLVTDADTPFRLMYVDLDKFKPINDTLGHDAGDFMLQKIGARLKASIREQDMAARTGGDEFALVLRSVHSDADADALMARIMSRVRDSVSFNGHDLSVGMSYGEARFPEDGKTRSELVRKADQRMYAAKAEKKRAA